MFRKLIVLTLILTAALSASAEFRWGPTAGVNFSTLHWKQKLLTTKGKTAGQAGVAAEIMIPGIGFGLDLGLRYGLNGANENFGDFPIWSTDGIRNQNVWIHTLQLPLNLKFKWTRMNGFEQTLAPFIFGGPVFNFNIATNKQPALEHPFGTVSMQCGAGVELLEKYQISGGYSWGISYQVTTVKLMNYSAQPRGWFINLTYLL